MEAKAGSYNKWYHHQNSMTSEFCKKYNVLEVQHLMSLTWSWDYSVSEPNGGAFKAKPVVNKIGENEMKARKSDPSSSQMRVGAPSNKSRLQIGARVLNFEASFHGSTCSPCLSSSATSLDKPLISKPWDLSSFDRSFPSLQCCASPWLLYCFEMLCDIHVGQVLWEGGMYVNEGRQSFLSGQYKQPATDMLSIVIQYWSWYFPPLQYQMIWLLSFLSKYNLSESIDFAKVWALLQYQKCKLSGRFLGDWRRPFNSTFQRFFFGYLGKSEILWRLFNIFMEGMSVIYQMKEFNI